MVIGHPNLNAVVEANAKASGFPAYFPEIGPYLTARGLIQFNAFMPKEGPDAWAVPTTLPADFTTAFLPVNTPVEDGQEMTVLGQKMQFFTKYGSDDKVHTTVWLPDRKILFTTMLWSSPPQLYSVRGDVFRDPREWIKGLKLNRNLEPEVLISAAARPVVGKEEVRKHLEGYLDGASFVLDQSLRGILGGKGPDDLRHLVRLPDYLKEVPNNLENYGEVSSYPPAIYYQAVGWYDNDAAHLSPVSPMDEAKRIVPLMGGRDGVMQAAKKAMDKKEYSWAGYAVFSNFGMKIFFAGGGSGKGLAVNNANKSTTFMKMIEVQAGFGMGVKKFRLIWVFENKGDLDSFINSGWEFGGQATAAAQASGEGAALAGAMSIKPGVWLYQLTDDGLAAELTAKGTKYYKDDKLN